MDEIEVAKLRWETKELGRLENLPPWEQPDALDEETEVPVVIDIARMENAMASKSVEVPTGMSKEEIRQLIIETANGDCV